MRTRLFTISVITILLLPFNAAGFQDDPVAVRLSSGYFQTNDQLQVRVKARSRVGRRFENVMGLELNLYSVLYDEEVLLGSSDTDHGGNAVWDLQTNILEQSDSIGYINFLVRLEGQEGFRDNEDDIQVRAVLLDLDFEQVDSSSAVLSAKMADAFTGETVEDAGLRFYIKRYFTPFWLSDTEFTDADGELNLELSEKYPGDRNGHIKVGVLLDDDDNYGTVQIEHEVAWGTPFIEDTSFNERTMWSTRDKTPLWLLIFPNLIILGVWGSLVFLVYKLYIISKS